MCDNYGALGPSLREIRMLHSSVCMCVSVYVWHGEHGLIQTQTSILNVHIVLFKIPPTPEMCFY